MKNKNLLILMVIFITVLFSALACLSASRITGETTDEFPPTEKAEIILESTPTQTMPKETVAAEPSATSTEIPVAGDVKINPIDAAQMVFVPEGDFLMGSDSPDSESHEQPMHTVWLDPFWIYQTEVTNAQFAAFVDSTGYVTTAEKEGWSFFAYGVMMERVDGANWRTPEGPGSDILDEQSHPVVHVSWYDAQAYCEWAGSRLPTEAQWEKAARGVDGQIYPWGNNPITGDLANYCDEFCAGQWADAGQNDGYSLTSPAGSYPAGASPYGALDMAGNVWEWTDDWYAANYYSITPGTNPQGPDTGEAKVNRGGSWFIEAKILRTFSRSEDLPEYSRNYTGFRCVQSPIP